MKEDKHWLEYAVGALLLGTLVAASIGDRFSYRQAVSAHKTLNVSRDQERRQLRAYVGITDVFLATCPIANQEKMVSSIKNFGQTPAYDVYMHGWNKVVPLRSDNVYPIEDYSKQGRYAREQVAFPASGFDAESACVPEPPSITSVIAPKVRLRYGTLFYTDAFNVHHQYQFCWFIGASDVHGTQCQNHNGTSPND